MRSDSGFERMAELFERARAMSLDERARWLALECNGDVLLRTEIEQLLDADSRDGPLDRADGLQRVADAMGASKGPARIGPYTIVRRIGGGGTATVYEAVQDAPRRTVALKLLRPGAADTTRSAQRLLFEAEVLARLRHPAVAQVYDVGQHEVAGERLPYLTLEYVEGARPAVEFAQGVGLDRAERLRLFLRIAAGVAHAHSRGILHRDLKPDNVLLDGHGQVKIVDFGVARLLDAEADQKERLTVSGQLVGTVQYMSPEQVSGPREDVDARTDVYALGLLLHELLLERRPYEVGALPLSEAVRVVLEREAHVDKHELPLDLRAILQKSLAKERERRYPTVDALSSDVEHFLAGLPVEARSPGTSELVWRAARRNPRLALALAALLVTFTGSAIVAARLGAWATRENARAARAMAQVEQSAQLLNEVLLAGLSPDQVRSQWQAEVLVERLAKSLDQAPPDSPAVEAMFRSVLAAAFVSNDNPEAAVREQERAIALWHEAGADRRLSLADALLVLADYRGDVQGDARGAREAVEQARAIRASVLGDDHLQRQPDFRYEEHIATWITRVPLAGDDGTVPGLAVATLPTLGLFEPLPRTPAVHMVVDDLGDIWGWRLLLENSTDWNATLQDGALVVDGVKSSGESQDDWHRVYAYRHPIEHMSDFELRFRVDWDARDSHGTNAPEQAKFLVLVELHGLQGGFLARAGISDGSPSYSGSVLFDHAGLAIQPSFLTKPGSLPYVGSAHVAIVRSNGHIAYSWDGRVLYEAPDPDPRPINGLMIHVGAHTKPYDHWHFEPGADRATQKLTEHPHFGRVTIAELTLAGVAE